MARYVISDLHYGHANIIDYCDRPFESVDAMNEALVTNWNRVVDPSDTVIYLGDLAMWGHDAAVACAERLNGTLVVVEGNHDDIDAARAPFPVVESCTISHGKYRFSCVHRPEDAPESAEWVLAGHWHDNDTREFPFIDPQRNRVNASVELIGYEPLALDRLCALLNDKRRYARLADAVR